MIGLIPVMLVFGVVNALIPIFIILILIAAAAGLTRGFSIFNLFGIATLLGIGVGAKAGITGKTGFSLPFMGAARKFRGKGIDPGKRLKRRIGRWRSYRKDTAPAREAGRQLRRAQKVAQKGGYRLSPRSRAVLSSAKNALGKMPGGTKLLNAGGAALSKTAKAGFKAGTIAVIGASRAVGKKNRAKAWLKTRKNKALNKLRLTKPTKPGDGASQAEKDLYKRQLNWYRASKVVKFAGYAVAGVLVPGLAFGYASYKYSKLGKEQVTTPTHEEYLKKTGQKLKGIGFMAFPLAAVTAKGGKALWRGTERLAARAEDVKQPKKEPNRTSDKQSSRQREQVVVDRFRSAREHAASLSGPERRLERARHMISTRTEVLSALGKGTIEGTALWKAKAFEGTHGERLRAAGFVTIGDLTALDPKNKAHIQELANRAGINYSEARISIRNAHMYAERQTSIRQAVQAHIDGPAGIPYFNSYRDLRTALKKEYYENNPFRSTVTGSVIRTVRNLPESIRRVSQDFSEGYRNAEARGMIRGFIAGSREASRGIEVGLLPTSNATAAMFIGIPRHVAANLSASISNFRAEIRNRPEGEDVSHALFFTAIRQPSLELIRESYRRALALIPQVPTEVGDSYSPIAINYPHLRSDTVMYDVGLQARINEEARKRKKASPDEIAADVRREYSPGQLILHGKEISIDSLYYDEYKKLREAVKKRGYNLDAINSPKISGRAERRTEEGPATAEEEKEESTKEEKEAQEEQDSESKGLGPTDVA